MSILTSLVSNEEFIRASFELLELQDILCQLIAEGYVEVEWDEWGELVFRARERQPPG